MTGYRVCGLVCLFALVGCANGGGDLKGGSAGAGNQVVDGGSGGTGGSAGMGGAGGVGQGGADCNEGDVQPCYGGDPALAGVGECANGSQTCEVRGEFTAWGECTGWLAPTAETCDGLDNNCDGTVDEGCCLPTPEVCDGVDNDCDGLIDTLDPDGCGFTSGCRLPFPPAATVPCDVAETAALYYVDALAGSDSNTGSDPSSPWATLQHAVSTAPDGSTIRVAAGGYGALPVKVDRPLIIKGGYDPAFTTWDPDANNSSYNGPLELVNDSAVWAGFRMISIAPPGGSTPWTVNFHTLHGGTFVRNVVGIHFAGDNETTTFQGVDARTDLGHTNKILCNDFYLSAKGPELWGTELLDLSGISGTVHVDSNRMCYDNTDPANDRPTTLISGLGACIDKAHSQAYITNNIIENAHDNHLGYGVEITGCGDDILSHNTMDVAVTNNTIVGGTIGVAGYSSGDGGAVVSWHIQNNIIVTDALTGTQGVRVNYDIDPYTVLAASNGNLIFGFGDNTVAPPPVSSAGDDLTGAWSFATVFIDPNSGDFRPVPGGPADGTGLNLHGNSAYGAVTKDLAQKSRPASGPWDRGALLK